MTPEQITQNLYVWLTHASRIERLPMGFRPCTWEQLQALDPALAGKWRDGVRAFLDAIEANDDDDEHLNFIGSLVIEETPLTAGADEGEEHRITPDGG